jgi:hypothetical protein
MSSTPTKTPTPKAGLGARRKAVEARFREEARQIMGTLDWRGMEARHRLGKLLNWYLGHPTTRQRHGGRVVEKLAKQLGFSKADVSRMRRFAQRFPCREDLKRLRGMKWSQVRDLLANPGRRKQRKGKKPGRAKEGSRPHFRCLKALDTLTAQLWEGTSADHATEANKEQWAASLQKFAQVALERLGIVVKVLAR